MNNDYRNSKYCPKLDKVIAKKKNLQQEIELQYPNCKDFYSVISKKKKKHREVFAKIYNRKCAYCGVSLAIHAVFEIDHYRCKKLFTYKDDAGQINNLIYSCFNCNRNKRDFEITYQYTKLLNPDDGSIAKVFFRADNYSIQIQKGYESDKVIQAFYKKMHFNFELRRLDYLLLCMCGLYKKMTDENDKLKLAKAITLLKIRRNVFIDKGLH